MAWERTALNALVAIGLIIRHLRHVPFWMTTVAIVMAALVVDVARRRARTIDTSRNPIALRSVSGAAVVLAAIGVAIVLIEDNQLQS